nr:hypothetical protein [Tanacetum cinerariifolium]GEZ50430.1 hypothetical protein [Tanacetum cinerariifolium]
KSKLINPSPPLHLVLCSSESKPSILPFKLWDCQLGTYGDSGSGYGLFWNAELWEKRKSKLINPSPPLHLVLCSSESKPSILPFKLWDCQLGTYGDSGSGYGLFWNAELWEKRWEKGA